MGTLLKHSKRSIRTGCEVCGIEYTAGDESTYLYLAHDTNTTHGEYCEPCDSFGALALMNPDGTQHMCRMPDHLKVLKPRVSQAKPKSEPGPEPKPVVKPTEIVPDAVKADPAPITQGTAESDLSVILRRLLGTPQIDRAEVERICRDIIGDTILPTRTVVIKDAVSHTVEGNAHPSLERLVKVLGAGEHCLMVGPAGTGKSTLAEQSAEALGLPSYSISLSPQTSEARIVGYYSATGDYIGTLFREAYENGGVFHFDEFDNGHPSILALCNAALANGHMAFPDGMVKRHPDFRCVASANTYGRGATRTYVGRQAIDGATLDRFAVLTIDVDEPLETWLCTNALPDDTEAVQEILRYVRKVRARVESLGLNVIVSPRASVGMCRLISAGFLWEDAVDARIRRGLPDDVWAKIGGL